MTGTTVPDVLPALVALHMTALPAPGWQVIDGPPYDIRTNFACVGYTGRPDDDDVTALPTPAAASMGPFWESIDIACLLSVHIGAQDLPSLRAIAYGGLRAIAALLADDRTLGGVVSTAQITDHRLAQELSETGTAATIRYTIHLEASGVD